MRTAKWPQGLLTLLDVVTAAYATLLGLYLLVGPMDLVVFSARRFSKVFLAFLLLVSLRAAIPRESWLTRLWQRGVARLRGAGEALAGRFSWAPAAFDAAAAILVTRAATLSIAFLALLLIPLDMPRPFTVPFESERFFETFAPWDAGWYFHIARRGYFHDAVGPSSTAFFPLYPTLMRTLAWPFGGSDRALWLAGIAISYACLFGGLLLLHRLTEKLLGDREAARRTVFFVAVFPFSYFFTQVYTESLFLLLTVGAVTAATASRWGWAGALGGLAAVTRPNGILVAVPLGILALAGRPNRRTLAGRAAALVLVPVALALYSAFVYRLTGDPLGWLHGQAAWGYSVGNRPWVELMRVLDRRGCGRTVDSERGFGARPDYFSRRDPACGLDWLWRSRDGCR
ncbi:MAG TPA: mannosyltransferase family protein, partial [Vicinamibacteria bacterium]|nr:mannosyltransferase family protein [Vicinamibacteria bacterium]